MALVERSEPTPEAVVLTMNRPEKLNAMSYEGNEELFAHLDRIAKEPDVRAVVLTGAGRGFCAGLDLTGYGRIPGTEDVGRPQTHMATQQHIASVVDRMRSLPQPIIAAVNGPAAGGGFALTLASDVRVLARSARMNAAFVKIGLSGCDIGVSWLLPRLVGASRAFELMLTGRIIDATEADAIGLATKVVDDDQCVSAALEIAAMIAANSPWGVRMTKEVMWSQLEVGSMRAGIDLENRTQTLSMMTEDQVEARRAFMAKRPAEFRNH